MAILIKYCDIKKKFWPNLKTNKRRFKMVRKRLFMVLFLVFSWVCFAQDYFGQTPPGDSAIVFAPGIVSLEGRYEYCPAFSPDGNQFYFGVTNSNWSHCDIWVTEYRDSQWTTQEKVSILDSLDGWIPYISPDGATFYLSSAYPSWPPANIWKCDIINDTLKNLTKLDAPINSNSNEWRVGVSNDSMMVFCSNRSGTLGEQDLYYAIPDGGTYTTAINFGDPVNSSYNDASVYIAPNGSYIMFESERPGGYGQSDIYISFKVDDSTWSNPQNMGPTINTSYIEDLPSITPDGQYLMFCRREAWVTSEDTDIWWISASIIDSLQSGIDLPESRNFKLSQNYPNPFNSRTVISYSISKPASVELNVYDVLGNKVRTLVNETQSAGDYDVPFDANNLSAGVYFCKLSVDGVFSEKKKMLFLR